MSKEYKIVIYQDFTEAPGAREKTDGDHSGEEFLEELLEPKFLEAKNAGAILSIDIDNTWGYASSFISGSFGALSEKYTSELVNRHINLVSKSDLLKEKFQHTIDNPNSRV